MQTHTPLLVVDIDRTGVFPSDQLAAALGYDRADIADTANDAVNALSRKKSGPRYVVVDIGVRGEDMIPMLASIAKMCDQAQLVVVGNVNDLGFYRSLKNIGVAEYFTHPASVSEVRSALIQQTASARSGVAERMQPGSVIAFMSAASGDGASTIAMNVAYAMTQETGKPAVLVDLDYQFGMVARHLDLQAQFGIRELFDYPERGVDETLVSKMLLQYGERLSVVAAPDLLRMVPAIRPDTVRELIEVLKSRFAYVLLDVPHIWTPWTAEALAQADRIVIVSQLWLRSLTHMSRLLAAFSDSGIAKEKVTLAVNRSGARFREGITPQDFERVCLKEIDFHFANDIKAVVGAENQGKTLLETGSHLLERQFREMARAFSGETDEALSKVNKGRSGAGHAKAGGLRGLFGKG